MTNPGREASDQQLQNASALATEAAACANLFCATLANLNSIAEQQMKGLLGTAITAAEVAHVLTSEPDSSAKGRATAKGGEVVELAGHLRSAADKIGQAGGSRSATEAETAESNQARTA